ncbi:MAG: dTMP kinase [Bacilli bacterium]
MNIKEGCFITLEGPEGAGKTTLLTSLATYFTEKGYEVVSTREPGGIEISERIREVILHMDHKHMDSRTEALLYAAARRQHLVEKVIPALESGKIVLCDRFIHSSYVYQGIGRGIGIAEVEQMNSFAVDQWFPDCTLVLDLPVEEGLARIQSQRAHEINRFDLESIQFHEKIRSGYLMLAEEEPEKIRVLDAMQPIEVVVSDAIRIIEPFLK